MVASIGSSSATFLVSRTQAVSGANASGPTQPSYASQTQDNTSIGGSGYTFTPAANISALAPDTASSLLSVQSDNSGSQTTTQQINNLNNQDSNANPLTSQNVQQESLQQATAPEGNSPQANTSVTQTINQQNQDAIQQQQQSNPNKPQYVTAGVNVTV